MRRLLGFEGSWETPRAPGISIRVESTKRYHGDLVEILSSKRQLIPK